MLATVGALGAYKAAQGGAAQRGVTAKAMADALATLAERRIGALFAFERGISLRGYEESGVATDAIITRELLLTVFTPPMPLHDGGAVVRHGRLASAHCIFPVSNNPGLAAGGMRHRAALGISEETDAIAVAVSEETGSISVAHNGKMLRYPGPGAAESAMRWVAKGLGEQTRGGGWLAKAAAAAAALWPQAAAKAKAVGK